MEINPDVIEVIQGHKIDKDLGLFFLLGVYHQLDVDTLVPEATVKAMALTKIVERDYETMTIKWNVPLYKGDVKIPEAYDWVSTWMDGFKRQNPARRGALKDVITRMKAFFADNPAYSVQDVFDATQAYFRTLSSGQYCMHSHKFIYDGIGAMKKSTLLQWCETVKGTPGEVNNSNQVGNIMR